MSSRRADKDEEKIAIALKVSKLLLGDPKFGIEPHKMDDITIIMGWSKTTNNSTAKKFKKLAIEKGFIDLDPHTSKPILPVIKRSLEFSAFTKLHNIKHDDYIKSWWEIESAKNGRKGTVVSRRSLNLLVRICNTLKINPEQIVFEKDPKVVEAFRNQYMKIYETGEAYKIAKSDKIGDIATHEYQINYALASFCGAHGISWARGTSTMSRKIQGHGKYSKTRLTKEELAQAEKWLIKKYGIDSDEYRWFWVGVETCSRFKALEGMKLQIEYVDKNTPNETMILVAFESKTKKQNQGLWDKFIKRKNTRDSLKALKSRGGTRIYENILKLSPTNLRIYFQDVMKELFTHLGKDIESLFFKRPAHVLRHIGAHYWLAKGNYANHVMVAKIGGWHTIDELIKSYGELPPDMINRELNKYSFDEESNEDPTSEDES